MTEFDQYYAPENVILPSDDDPLILMDPELLLDSIRDSLEDDRRSGHLSHRFRIQKYQIESVSMIPSEGTSATASCNLLCWGTPIGKTNSKSAAVRFVRADTRTPIRTPKRNETNGFIEIFMHCSMIPMVLEQLKLGPCNVVFEDKGSTPFARFENVPSVHSIP